MAERSGREVNETLKTPKQHVWAPFNITYYYGRSYITYILWLELRRLPQILLVLVRRTIKLTQNSSHFTPRELQLDRRARGYYGSQKAN